MESGTAKFLQFSSPTFHVFILDTQLSACLYVKELQMFLECPDVSGLTNRKATRKFTFW